jgi:glycosyltransferase involved in cell wall biosynthesis
VIIPAYNRAHTLERALGSVWSQKPMLPAEVIVVDDGSDDDTSEVATKLGAKVIRHPHNRGPAAARNTGLNATSHPWVALLDSDDEWLPHHLSHLWEISNGHALVASSALRCAIGPARDRFHGPMTNKPVVLHSGNQLIYPENVIPTSASMFKREAAIAAGGFQARHGVVEDLDLWLRILERDTGICSPQVGIIYHIHGEQLFLDFLRMQRGRLEVIEAHRRRTNGSRVPLQHWEGVAAWYRLLDASKTGHRRHMIRWSLYIISRPRRLRGSLRTIAMRYQSIRRAAALRAAGVGRDHR